MRLATLGFVLLFACACDMVDVYQRQIERASRTIEAATSDTARAAAFADRGRGYSDKARLSKMRGRIDRDEYLRLFTLALDDHDRAVALDDSAPSHFARGLTNYDRAAQVQGLDEDRGPWFDAARLDFTRAVERDPSLATAHDYLGLVEEQTGRFDEAIAAYTREMALEPRLGRLRLAELYCTRGQAYLKDERFELAAASLEKSVDLSGISDGCSCEPYNALAYVYIDATAQYDKGADLVRRALSSGHVIAPEYIARLEKRSRP